METQSQPSAGTSAPGAKRTRKRAVMACLECNRRKQKVANSCLYQHLERPHIVLLADDAFSAIERDPAIIA